MVVCLQVVRHPSAAADRVPVLPTHAVRCTGLEKRGVTLLTGPVDKG